MDHDQDDNFHSLEEDPEIARASRFATDYEEAIRARKRHFPDELETSEMTTIPDFDTRLRHASEVVVQDQAQWMVPKDGSLLAHDLTWDNPHDARDFVAYLYSISDLSNILSSCFHDLYERLSDEDQDEETMEVDADWHHALHNWISSLKYLLPLAHKATIREPE